MAPISGRLRSKVCMAILKPVPSAPRRASFGTRTSSKTTSEVSAARWQSLSFMAMYHCATLPFEMKCLVPFRTNSSPTRR